RDERHFFRKRIAPLSADCRRPSGRPPPHRHYRPLLVPFSGARIGTRGGPVRSRSWLLLAGSGGRSPAVRLQLCGGACAGAIDRPRAAEEGWIAAPVFVGDGPGDRAIPVGARDQESSRDRAGDLEGSAI